MSSHHQTASFSRGVALPAPLRLDRGRVNNPISQEVITWLLFWPILSLIARQAVYFAGPARTAEGFQNGAAMEGARGSHFYIYVNFIFLLGFVLAGHREIWATLKENSLVLAMLGVAACSTVWSASPMITVHLCIEVSLCTLFACYLSTRYTTERLMELLGFMGLLAALLNILFAVALPSYGIFEGYAGGAWQGICNHKNTLGLSMAFLLSPVFFTKSHGRGRRLTYGVLLLFLIYKSQSRGAWFDTAAMLFFVACLSLIRRVRVRELALILWIFVPACLITIAVGVHFWPLIAEQMGKSPTMTGRTEIYAEVWRSIMKHPVLGYGFGGFWIPGNPEYQRVATALGWPNIGYAENGILDLALQVGFFGVGLVVLMIARATIQGIRLLRSPHYTPRVGWFVTVLFLAALTNIDAGWFMTPDTLDWVLILVSCIGLNKETRRAQSCVAVLT